MVTTEDDESSILLMNRFTQDLIFSLVGTVHKEFYLGTIGRTCRSIRLWTDFAILANVLYQLDKRELLELNDPRSSISSFSFSFVPLSILIGVYIHGLLRNFNSPLMKESKQLYSQ